MMANTVKALKKNSLPIKSKMIKITKMLNLNDIYLFPNEKKFSFLEMSEHSFILKGMIYLLLASKMIYIEDDKFNVNKVEFDKYIKLDDLDKVSFLLDCYINSERNDIYDIMGVKYRIKHPENKLVEARKTIIKYLKL